jgi:hypothetical protein
MSTAMQLFSQKTTVEKAIKAKDFTIKMARTQATSKNAHTGER